jgi:tape measure domain-containing protein
MSNNDISLRLLINAQDNTSGAFGRTRANVDDLDRQLEGIKNRVAGLLGLSLGDALFGKIGDLIHLADNYKNLEARLKLVSDNTKELSTAQKELFDVALRTGSSLEATYSLYGKVETAVKQLGGTQREAIQTTETLAKAIALTSQGAAQDEAALQQFGQALGKGALNGDELTSVMENSLGLAEALANGLGVTTAQLKDMGAAGELTSDRLIEALGKSAPKVAEQFAQLPLTIGRAWNQLTNQVLRYVGEADKANGASQSLATVISALADHFDKIASTGIVVAELFAFKLVSGIAQSTVAWTQNMVAMRAANAAALQLLQTEIRRSEIAVQKSLNLIREAQLQRALAATEQQRVAAQKALDAAYVKHEANVTALQAQQALLNQSTRQGALGMLLFGNAVGVVNKAFALLNRAFIAFLLFDLGKTLYDWAIQFKTVQQYMVALGLAAEQVVIVLSSLWGLARGNNWDEMNQKLESSRLKWLAQAAAIEQGAVAEEKAAEIAVTSNETRKKSIAATKAAYADFAQNLEAYYQREQQLIADREQQQIHDLNTTVADEQQRARLITDVIIAGNQERLQLASNYTNERIRIIDAMYDKEINKARLAGLSTTQAEREAATAKLAVLKELESATRASIDKMIADEERHAQRAMELAQDRVDAERSAEETLQNFLREGLDEYGKAQSFANEESLNNSRLRQAQAEGDFEAQKEIAQRLMELALERGRIERQIAEDNEEYAGGEVQHAVDRFNAAKDAMLQALEGMQAAEQNAADKSRDAAEGMKEILAQVQDQVAALHQELATNTQSTHTVSDNVDEVIARIKSMDGLNTQSTHTVTEVVEQARRFGGMIHGFNQGGQLPGWGGGDTIPAMLEPGEFVIRKEAVAKYGAGLFDRLNRMRDGAGEILKRRVGGIIPVRGYSFGGSVRAQAIAAYSEKRTNLDADWRAAITQIQQSLKDTADQFRDSMRQIAEQNGSAVQQINQRFNSAADTIVNGAVDTNKSIDDNLREIRRSGLTELQVYQDKQRELSDLQSQADAALRQGDFDAARTLQQQVIQLANSLSKEVKDKDGQTVVSQPDAERAAVQALEQARERNARLMSAQLADAQVKQQVDLANQAVKHALEMRNLNEEHRARLQAIEEDQRVKREKNREDAQAAFREFFEAMKPKFEITIRNSGGGGRGFAVGGSVPGIGNGDTVRAMLTPGEWVIKKASVAKYGYAFLDAVNRGTLPQQFATGGPVLPASPIADGKTVTVNFKGPDGAGVSARFGSESEVNQFLSIIKQSGGVTA